MPAQRVMSLCNRNTLRYYLYMNYERRRVSIFSVFSLLLLCTLLFLGGCERQEKFVAKKEVLTELDVWVHTESKEALAQIQDQVDRFNGAHNRIHVTLISVPRGAYQAQINAAIITGTLPDIIELDGPYLPHLVERNVLLKLDKILTETTREDMLPAVFQQGMYDRRVYSLASTTNSHVMYARKSAIQAAGYRVPDAKEGWSVEEFEKVLSLLMANSDRTAILDLGLNDQNERLTRTLYPILLSVGGGFFDEQAPYVSDGVLNSVKNKAVLTRIQHWIKQGFIDENRDDEAFIRGRALFSWAGLEKYNAYRRQFGDDLVVIPLPDFGHGSKRVQRAWGWGLTTSCEDRQSAMRFLEFLFQPDEVLLSAKANATLPATYSALARFEAFNDTPSLMPLVEDQQAGEVVSQLKSPLYPVVSNAFQKAFVRIRNGASVEDSLDTAVKMVDEGRRKFESELEKLREGDKVGE